ncbi:DUF2339 domain-containing protein [Nitrobacteraceae bacterium UC4446_H13]
MEFLALLIAIAAVIVARKALNRANALQARVQALEAAGKGAIAMPPPLDIPLQPTTEEAASVTESSIPVPPPLLPDPDESQQPPPIPTPAAAASGARIEERIGTRWVVWLGGLTLALGGFFMVRYSIEEGLLGPGVRVLLGGLFAVALLAAGEWTRRRDDMAAIAPLPIANIPAILTAAGTAVAFATVYAAYALYDFLVPATAFVLLGLVALGTLAAALLHGPALAGLGVVGAFATPVLVSSERPEFWALYIYIAIVTAAAFGLARIRLWRWLAITTVVFALLWTIPCLDCGPSMIAPHAFHVIVGFALAAVLVVCGLLFGPPAEPDKVEPVSSSALAAYALGATMIVLGSGHAMSAITVFGVLVVATLAIAWRAPAAIAAVAANAVLVAIVFLEWAVRANPDMLVLPGGAMPGLAPSATDESVSAHLISAAIFAAGFAVAGFAAQGRSIRASVPVIWAASAVFTPIALLIALYARVARFDQSIPFAIIAVVLAAVFGWMTETLSRREPRPGHAISAALFATGTLGALALALTFALERGWLTIALALMSAGTAWVATKRPIPFLRWLAAILAAIVVARIGYEPRIAGEAIGSTIIFNWLLWGYGIPALSFWTASSLLRKRGDDVPLRMIESAAILFTVLLAFMEIRHAVNGGRVYANIAGLTEVALQVCVALAMAIGLERLRIRSRSIVHDVAAVLLTIFACLAALFGLLGLDNPMIWHIDVGGVVVNLLLLGYALPAALMLTLSYLVAGRRARFYGHGLAAGALVLALAYVTLEIRRIYHGPIMNSGGIGDAEQYTYTIAWLAFGVVLLAAGVLFNSQRARLASAAVIALTILKAFMVDMSELTGVYRALSFMVLGLVLVAIGWLYQRILFRNASQPPAQVNAPPAPPEA